MGKVIGLTLIVFLMHGQLLCQTLTLNQFLRSSLDDPYYQSFDLQHSLLQDKKSYSLPWINQLQVRFQDNEFDDFRNRSGVRIVPGNPWQIDRNNQYFRGTQVLKTIEQKLVLKQILRRKYEMAVEYWMTEAFAKLALEQQELKQRIGKALEQKSGSNGFDADQFLNNQLEIIGQQADIQEANFKSQAIRAQILQSMEATSFDWPESDRIEVDQINQLVEMETKSANRTEFELMKQRVELSTKKMKLEISNFDIGYLQGMYSTDNQTDGANKFGIALGINIPISNTNKNDVAREKLAIIERQGELDRFQLEETGRIAQSAFYLKLHLGHYQKLDSLITAVKLRGLNLPTSVANNFDPIIQLKYQEKMLRFDWLKAKIKNEILIQYISFLDNAGKLHERPLVNYLSRDLSRIGD